MWLEVIYSPTSLFSLKSSSATNSAGKSLLSPSPYSVKMALLSAIITYESLEMAEDSFTLIRGLEMLFALPESIVVNNCLIRILKDNDKISKEEKIENPYKNTVAFREYVYLDNDIKIALSVDSENQTLEQDVDFLKKWFMHINYFGKRGCFFQYKSAEIVDEIDNSIYCSPIDKNFKPGVYLQMDDVDPKADFDSMNNYSPNKAKRISRIYAFPFSLKKMSKTYSFYSRVKF
jgi:hypothetical protein